MWRLLLRRGISKCTAADPVSAIKGLARAKEQTVACKSISDAAAPVHCKFLTLPDDISFSWWRTGRGGQKLLIRECYNPMFGMVWRHANRGRPVSGTVVLGNPGIGKTGFLWFSLWKLLQQKQRIILKLPTSNNYICVDWVAEKTDPQVTTTKVLPSKLWDTESMPWYLADQTIPVEDWGLYCKFLLTCSPLKANYFEFAKSGGVRKLYDPIWTLNELLALNEHSFRHPTVDVDTRFQRWGGIPRYVLDKVDSGSQQELDEVIGTVRDADQIMRLQGDQSNGIFHMVVDESAYSSFRLALASHYVETKVFSNLAMPSLKRLLSTPQPESIRDIQGKLLELFLCDKVVPKGGKLLYKELQRDGSWGSTMEEILLPMIRRHDLPRRGCEAVLPSHPLPEEDKNAMFKPTSARNVDWDFIADGSIFQVTVSPERGLRLGDGTQAALAFLRGFPAQEKKKINLYILVPAFNLDTFMVDWFDTIKPVKGAERRSQEDLPMVIEAVMSEMEHLNVSVRVGAFEIGDLCPTCMGEGKLFRKLYLQSASGQATI